MRFISVDIEANQPSGQIAQIGAVAYDTDRGVIGEFSDFLALHNEDLNKNYVLNNGQTLGGFLGPDWVVNWALKMVDRDEVFIAFWQWVESVQCGKKFVQWGTGDMRAISQQSSECGVEPPSRTYVHNLKPVYQLLYQPALKLPRKYGLRAACEAMGVGFEGRAHDALVDAQNTAKLAAKMFKIVEDCGKIRKVLEV